MLSELISTINGREIEPPKGVLSNSLRRFVPVAAEVLCDPFNGKLVVNGKDFVDSVGMCGMSLSKSGDCPILSFFSKESPVSIVQVQSDEISLLIERSSVAVAHLRVHDGVVEFTLKGVEIGDVVTAFSVSCDFIAKRAALKPLLIW